MKSARKLLVLGVLGLIGFGASLMMSAGPASANTELVPAARLAVPFWDTRAAAGRDTFILLTNASPFIDLSNPLPPLIGTPIAHMEFYDHTCVRCSMSVPLSPGDIDQLDLITLPCPSGLASDYGFADIDVRNPSEIDPARSGIQFNVLMGTVVVADIDDDWAAAYPAASSLGSSFFGLGGVIVQRVPFPVGNVWFGRYETYPDAVAVPGFFAEGAGVLNTVDSILAVAGMPDGNWFGFGFFGAEAPGDALPNLTVPVAFRTPVNGNGNMYDGCEHLFNYPMSGHHVTTTLRAVNFNAQLPWAGSCPAFNGLPAADEFSGATVGWMTFLNDTAADSSGANRGVVGTNLQTAVSAITGLTSADITRLWGAPYHRTWMFGCTDGFFGALLPVNADGGTCYYNMFPSPSFADVIWP